ncbi:MAG TPA: prepilin-type N-terminal cleavage/methylation domain-containing protein [Candidatus Saccharimonadales bacterium]
MSRVKNQKGFTLVEIMLFLAISGLVLVIGFAGISGRNANVQFTDSIRSLDFFMQKQFNNVLNGVNVSSDGRSSGGDQVLLGKYLVFTEGSGGIQVFDLIGDRLSEQEIQTVIDNLPSGQDPDRAILFASSPQAVTASPNETYTLDWGVRFLNASKNNPNNTAADGFAIVRSPKSGRIFLVGHDSDNLSFSRLTNGNPSDDATLFDPSANGYMSSQVSLNLCFHNDQNRRAVVMFGGSSAENSFDIGFDPDRFDSTNTRCGFN